MSRLPSPEQLPSYADVAVAFRRAARQCIWYIPAAGRKCTVDITIEEMKSAWRLMRTVGRAKSADTVVEALLQVVKLVCCDQYHRDVVQNKGLDKLLVARWFKEISASNHGLASEQTYPDLQTRRVTRGMTLRASLIGVDAQDNITAELSDDGLSELQDLAADTTNLSLLLDALSLSEPDAHFRPHKRLPDENVGSTLLQRLKSKDIKARREGKRGAIYLFTQHIFPGMVKIGYTYAKTESRLDYWSKCGHGKPDLVKKFDRVQCAEQVETLVHFELIQFWRKERHCARHGSAHVEWFEMGANEATTVAELWIEWIERADPYDADGNLTEPWRDVIRELNTQEIAITARMLLDLHELPRES